MSDDELLLELLLAPNPAVLIGQLSERIDLTNEQIRNRMADLEDAGLVTSHKSGNRLLYWLTPKGRNHVTQVARDALSSGQSENQ